MTISIMPVRRDIRFKLNPSRITNWHKSGTGVSQFLNTMSLFFPVGERFFIDSVRHYRDVAKDDPELKAAITAFIGQEAMHGREHEEMNELLNQAGCAANTQEKMVLNLLKLVQKITPKSFQLAATVSLEHLTAILGDMLLNNREHFFENADEGYAKIWMWHALEETEHKAVAFDVFQKAMKDHPIYSYLLRVTSLPLATGIFFVLCYSFYVHNMARIGEGTNWKQWFTSFNYQWGKPGMLRQTIRPWLDWFKPSFHPWDHDNRQFLELVDSVVGDLLEADKAA